MKTKKLSKAEVLELAAAARLKARMVLPYRTCEICGVKYQPVNFNQKFCGNPKCTELKKTWYQDKYRKKLLKKKKKAAKKEAVKPMPLFNNLPPVSAPVIAYEKLAVKNLTSETITELLAICGEIIDLQNPEALKLSNRLQLVIFNLITAQSEGK